MKNKAILILLAVFLISSVSASQVCQVYDDFISSSLDISKWEIRQDVEGQSFMEEYWIDTGLQNFHMQQNEIGDRRTYLFPKQTFTTGDIIEWDTKLISREGNYGHMVLLTGDQYIRIGIFGYSSGVQGYDELGTSHIKIEFQENNFHLERTTPSNITLIDNLALTNANGNYELYVGAGSGHNGKTHIDFDNFTVCKKLNQPTLEERISILEQKITELENKTYSLQEENNNLSERMSFLEKLVDKIIKFIKNLPHGLGKRWID